MEITNIKFYQNSNRINYKNRIKLNNFNNGISSTNTIKSFMPLTSQYLAFCGGYSIDLKEVKRNLDSSDYPCDIEKMVNNETENDSYKNKTLYDVHFDKYKEILDCYSLDKLKEKYPEFSDVISVFDVSANKGSFIDKYFEENLDAFTSDEDLTLSLIKLYWGEGFSLNDLANFMEKNEGEKINLYHTMKKLNIPLMNQHYAIVLKLSNKDYNEHFCEILSQKIKEAHEIRSQKAQGEAVVIPRGKLSEAHKKKISDSLKKYFKEHPEKIYEQSQRQKQFYEENPKFKEEMSIAMKHAWNSTQEGKTVKKYLSRFMKKYNQKLNDEELFSPDTISKEKQKALDEFWKRNPWAKEKFSIATKKGWEYLKSLKTRYKEKYTYNLYPSQIRKDLEEYAKKYYPDKEFVSGEAIIYSSEEGKPDDEYKKIQETSEKIVNKYFDNHARLDDELANAKLFTLMKIKRDLENNSDTLPESLKQNRNKRHALNNIMEGLFLNNPIYRPAHGYKRIPIGGVKTTVLSDLIKNIILSAILADCEDFIAYYEAVYDDIWSYFDENKMNQLVYLFK